MGSVETLRAGELQRMTAGIGIVHSEFNASKTEPLHFFQIWIRPSRNGLTPSYEPMALTPEQKAGKLFQVAPPDTGAMKINQDARVFVGDVTAGGTLKHAFAPGRFARLHLIRGGVSVNGNDLETGDAAAITAESTPGIQGRAPASEVLLFDLA